jgi:hypothetical protein
MGITPYFIFLGRKRPLRNKNYSQYQYRQTRKKSIRSSQMDMEISVDFEKFDIQVSESDHRETPRRWFCAAYRIVTSGAAKVSIVARAKDISILFYLVRVCNKVKKHYGALIVFFLLVRYNQN